MKFVSNRDINVGTTLGHSIQFKKGVPQDAPREIHSILIEKGILPVEEDGSVSTAEVTQITADAAGPREAPEEAEQREDAILEAMKRIVKKNDAKDFAASTPAAHAVQAILGWRTDQKEVRKVWEKNRQVILAAVSGA